jgi:hypothetical protein
MGDDLAGRLCIAPGFLSKRSRRNAMLLAIFDKKLEFL